MNKIKITQFDASDYLTNDVAIAEYLNAVLEENDSALLIAALGDIAKAKGMTQIAKDSGLSRESLYKALTVDSKPRFETVQKVLGALGMSLTVKTQSFQPCK